MWEKPPIYGHTTSSQLFMAAVSPYPHTVQRKFLQEPTFLYNSPRKKEKSKDMRAANQWSNKYNEYGRQSSHIFVFNLSGLEKSFWGYFLFASFSTDFTSVIRVSAI